MSHSVTLPELQATGTNNIRNHGLQARTDLLVFLVFIVSSFKVTEENSLFETEQPGRPSFFLIFSLLLEELTFIFSLELNDSVVKSCLFKSQHVKTLCHLVSIFGLFKVEKYN